MWANVGSTSAVGPIFSKVPGELHIKQLSSFQPTTVLGLKMGGFLYCSRQDLNSGSEGAAPYFAYPPPTISAGECDRS